jgi:small subunit ribosomal protein S3
MGHKVNPIGLRLGINRTWDSRWFAGTDYSKLLHEDFKLRNHLRTKLRGAGVARVVIERPAKKPRVTIYAARPGVVIGKKGQDIEVLKKDLSKMAKADVSRFASRKSMRPWWPRTSLSSWSAAWPSAER